MTQPACRVVVRGRVQGVYFRASTAERADALSVSGFARNQRDGSVLVHATGTREALDELVAWLHHGPPMAHVESVEVEAIDPGSVDWPRGFLRR